MSDFAFQILAIGIYFAAMLAIGFYAFNKTSDHEGYMLAGRDLPPWVAALSAGASDMSGWLMMGLPGAIYVSGLIEGWIAIGLTIGAYLNWKVVAPRLRAYSEISKNSITIPSFFENRLRDQSRLLRIASGIIILVFFTFYVSSGMVAGGVFFESSFESTYLFGMILVSVVTLIYTLFGGFLGASLTDVVQGLIMMIALFIIPVAGIMQLGGWGPAWDSLRSLEPHHLSFISGGTLDWPTIISIVSALGWGLGYFGQPHIIVRFMAMRSPAAAKSARRIGIGWMAISLIGAVVVGLVGVAFFAQDAYNISDPETVALLMAQYLLHPLVAGFVFAAVLAAVMSTISSQLIVSSSALVEDLYKVIVKKTPSERFLLVFGRIGVLGVGVIAMVLAINPSDTILGLVSFAWAGFGASFGPAILLMLFWRKLTNWGALVGMVFGAATVFIWSAMDTGLYEIIPGFAVNLVFSVIVSLVTYKQDAEIEDEFTQTTEIVLGR